MTIHDTTVTYCDVPNCGERTPLGFSRSIATDGRRLCDSCVQQAEKYLTNVEKNYPALRNHVRPGSVAPNPDVKPTKQTVAPLPVRVDVIDLADERHYLIGGYEILQSERVRGTVGRLQRWAMRVRSERAFTKRPEEYTIDTELTVLDANWQWVLSQPWAADMLKDLRRLNRAILDAVGKYGAKPVGRCPTVIDHDSLTCSCGCHDGPDGLYACSVEGGCATGWAEKHPKNECRGPLLVSAKEFGVFCPACKTKRGEGDLRRLGLMLDEPPRSEVAWSSSDAPADA